MLEGCNGFSNIGSNPFVILEPVHKLILKEEDGESSRLEITVLKKQKQLMDVYQNL